MLLTTSEPKGCTDGEATGLDLKPKTIFSALSKRVTAPGDFQAGSLKGEAAWLSDT